jgi:hypothetical protein
MRSTTTIPTPLVGNLQSYWLQHPGARLDERLLRSMLYDYTYLRRTGQQIHAKYLDVTAHRAMWETKAALRMGQWLGPFLYPTPSPL